MCGKKCKAASGLRRREHYDRSVGKEGDRELVLTSGVSLGLLSQVCVLSYAMQGLERPHLQVQCSAIRGTLALPG